MRRTSIRLITVLLAVVLLVSLGAAALAANAGTTVTKDGVKAHLYTDKESYASGNAVDARVKVDNETGKKISVSISIQVPNGVKLAGSASSAATVEAAKSYTTPGPKNPGSSTPGTGDGTPLLLLALLAVLSACGIGVWVIFGRKFRSMVSLLLVISMVASMGLMAVPAKAADLEGTIELSCPIKVDGKAATVTATVTYTISGGTADETTPDESTPDESTPDGSTPDESTPDESTPDESTPDESTPDESTPDESTPDESTPDESTPDESTPDESTPDESTPDESTPDESTPDESTPDESTPDESTPDETTPDETTPDEDEPAAVPTETAYYLVWDAFTMVSANSESEQGFSSWDFATPAGVVSKTNGGAQYSDNSAYSDAHIVRTFNATSEGFTWEFTVKADATLEGTKFDLRNGDVTAISLVTEGGKLYAGETELADISSKFVNIKAQVNVAEGTYTLMADGKAIPGTFTFANETDKIDRMYIQTTEAGKGSVGLGTVRIYVGYYINEKFLDVDAGVPADWTVTGDATTAYKTGTQDRDYYSAKLVGNASMARDVAYEQAGSWVEAQILNPDNSGEVAMILSDGENEFKVAIKEGKFGYYKADGSFTGLYDCLANLWYHVMLKDTDEGTFLYLNHKEKAEVELPFEKFTNIKFETTGVTGAYVDDIIVRDWIPYPDDYVPTPVSGSDKDTANDDGIVVGLQSCSLWTEGHHFGWDWLTDWEERKTVLGWYDEYLPETADWELKFKVEHGIDYELFCWYRPQSSNNAPIKYNRNAEALHEGYFNARYSDMMKFAITWECAGGPVADSNDFRTNVVPYWIEQYFKDERYLVIDNKPVVGMYNLTKLMSYFGGTVEGVKAELDYLRQACIDADFDGCYIIMSNSNASDAAGIVEAGFDGQYAYTWGRTAADATVQKNSMTNVQNAIVNAGGLTRGIIPVATMGFNDLPWDRDDGGIIDQKNWEEVLNWIKEDFMETLSPHSLGSKMILLDNWNEFGEGHYLMPATGTNGFGYLDAVREIFGDGNTSHTDVVPNATQLARINHLFIQDRVVVKVDKAADVDMEEVADYVWTFDEDENSEDEGIEGWTVAPEDHDKYRHELKEFKWLEGGYLYGKSHDDPADLGTMADGGARVIDPSIQSPALTVDAGEVRYIVVRIKCSAAAEISEIFFANSATEKYSSGKCVTVAYDASKADEDGFVELVFDMNSSSAWTGTIAKLRYDVIANAGDFTIDSIKFMRAVGQDEAKVFFESDRVVTETPIKVMGEGENAPIMYPAEELGKLPVICTWAERLDGTAFELYMNGFFFSMPYDANKIIVNGVEQTVTQGATKVDDEIYIPIEAIMAAQFAEGKNEEGETETYAMYVTERKVNEKDGKPWVNFSLDTSRDPYNYLKAWYFDTTAQGWVSAGGGYLTSDDGTICLTMPSAFAGNRTSPGAWSPESSMNVSAAQATHIRVRVKNDAAMPNYLVLQVYYNGLKEHVDYRIEYTENDVVDGYAEVLIDLSTNPDYAKKVTTIERLYISGVDDKAIEVGKSFWLDSVEVLRDKNAPEIEVPEVPEPDPTQVKVWYFDGDKDVWYNGGSTVLDVTTTQGYLHCYQPDQVPSKEDATQMVTNTDTQARIWTKSLGLNASEVDTLRVRFKVSDDNITPNLKVYLFQKKDSSADGVSVDVPVTGQKDEKGFYTATITLTELENWSQMETLDQLGIYDMMEGCQEFTLDSVELLKLDQSDVQKTVKVLIIGNSITKHGVNESYGWLGDWGMAATKEENDYVHRLIAKVNAKYSNVEFKWVNVSEYEKYFYDFSNIGNLLTDYTNWNADIIIATFGANVKNGENEGDMSFENDQIFTKEHYKKIVDQFNPGGDAKIIVGSTILTKSETVDVIEEAVAANADWAYANMTEYTASEYRGDEEALQEAFDIDTAINAGVLTHPGDKGMEAIANELWPLLDAALTGVAEELEIPVEPGTTTVETIEDLMAAQDGATTLVLTGDMFVADETVTVWNGEFYKNITVEENGKLTVPLAALKMTQKGQYTLKVTALGGTYNFTEVWNVDKVITTLSELNELRYTGTNITGYYILGNDIDGNDATVTGGSNAWNKDSGFLGTFDGRNYTIKNLKFQSQGIFGSLGEATVKNVKFTGITVTGAAAILGRMMHSTTVENITIELKAFDGSDAVNGECGILSKRKTSDCVFKNITVDANGCDLANVLGNGWGSNTLENYVINEAGTVTKISASGGDNGCDTPSTTVPAGLTINYKTTDPEPTTKETVETFIAAQGGATTLDLTGDMFTVGTTFTVSQGTATKEITVTETGKLTVTLADLGMTQLGQYTVKATANNTEYSFVDVWNVTKVITTLDELLAEVRFTGTGAGQSGNITGYFILGNDIDGNGASISGGSYTWNDTSGFLGTFDGRGHTIKNVTFQNHGIFGSLGKSTVKNVNFTGITVTGSAAILGRMMHSATVENINIVLKAFPGSGVANGECGILAKRETLSSTFRNITVDANGCDLQNVLGNNWSSNNKIENYVINNAGTVTMISANGGNNGNETPSTTVPAGLTINYKATEETVETFIAAQGGATTLDLTGDMFTVGTTFTVSQGESTKQITVTETGKLTVPLADLGMTELGQYTVKATANNTEYSFVDVWNVTKVITTMADLAAVKNTSTNQTPTKIEGYFILGNDIINATQAKIDGAQYNWKEEMAFVGTFDGRGHTIRNVEIAANGIFGQLGKGAVVRNLIVDEVELMDSSCATVLAGIAYSSTIENIQVRLVQNKRQTNHFGLLTSRATTGNTFKDITVDANGCSLYSILGTQFGTNTVINYVVNNVGAVTSYGYSDEACNNAIEKPTGLTVNLKAVDPTVVKEFTFNTNHENWVNAGGNTRDSSCGALIIKQTSNNITLACWSPENLGIAANTVTHIRVRVKTDTATPTLILRVYGSGGTVECSKEYGSEVDKYGYATVEFELSTHSGYSSLGTINRLWISGNNNQIAQVDQSFQIDSVELLNKTTE